MTLRTWLGRRFARWTVGGREVAPRRHPLAATLTLDRLPDRDSPSSIDVSEFALVMGAGMAAGLGTSLRTDPRPTTTDRVDRSRSEWLAYEVRWNPPAVPRSPSIDTARLLGLSDPLPVIPFPTQSPGSPAGRITFEPRRQLDPPSAPPDNAQRPEPRTGRAVGGSATEPPRQLDPASAPADGPHRLEPDTEPVVSVIVDRAEAFALPVTFVTPTKPPQAKTEGPPQANALTIGTNAAPPADPEVEQLNSLVRGRIAWVQPAADPAGEAEIEALSSHVANRIVWLELTPASAVEQPNALQTGRIAWVEFAPTSADPAGEAGVAALRSHIADHIVWVELTPTPPVVVADPIIDLEYAPAPALPAQETPLPPATQSVSPTPATNGRGKAPYNPTPLLVQTADGASSYVAPFAPTDQPPVVVSPIPAASGHPARANTPVFHIAAAAPAGGPVVVPYTLAAHTAAGPSPPPGR